MPDQRWVKLLKLDSVVKLCDALFLISFRFCMGEVYTLVLMDAYKCIYVSNIATDWRPMTSG